MLDRMVARLFDWLIVIVVVCLLLWFFITQPLFSVVTVNDLPEVSETNLRNHVANFNSIEAARQTSKNNALSADDYIFNYFSRLGKPVLQSFSTATGRYNNVILKLGPSTKERIIIGVRYLPIPDANKKHINGSGLAVMLETARLFSQYAKELPISVEFVAYGDSNSDSVGAGSLYHAGLLRNKKIPVRVMLELQSVGYYREVNNSQAYPFSFMEVLYSDKGNFIALSSRFTDFSELRLVKRGFSQVPNSLVASFSTPEAMSVADGVDHVNYWGNSYPAIQVSDLLPLRVSGNEQELVLNYSRMSQVVKGLYLVVKEQKPSKSGVQEGYLDRMLSVLAN